MPKHSTGRARDPRPEVCRFGHSAGGDPEFCYMGHSMEVDVNYHPLYVAALAADEAFQKALVEAYGLARASDARYAASHRVVAVVAAKAKKLEADEAWRRLRIANLEIMAPCPHCAKESEMLAEAGVTDPDILSVPAGLADTSPK